MWLFLLGFLILGCGDEPGEDGGGDNDESSAPDPRSLVEVASVAVGSVGNHLVGSATVESEAQATLVPEATGVVTSIQVEEGDFVKKGQLLAILASPSLEGGFARAREQRDQTRRDAETARRLFGQGAISKSELDAADAAARAAETAHDEASQTKGFTRLVTPISGTVSVVSVRYGEVAGMQPAFQIVDLDRLRVVVPLPERDASKVRPGLPVRLVSAYDETANAEGKVQRVSPVIESSSGTFRTTVGVVPGQRSLRPGQFVSVRIEVDRHDGVLTVPRRALIWEEGKAYVYRVTEMTAEEIQKEEEDKKKAQEAKKEEEPGGFDFSFGGEDTDTKPAPEIPGPKRKASRVAVVIGYEEGETAEILSGVVAGEQVVVVGNEALRDGARVRLPGDPTVAKSADPDEGAKPTEAG